ncbi:hypothetical protein WP50_14935, partial [Lactiplantibacillus plantarum]
LTIFPVSDPSSWAANIIVGFKLDFPSFSAQITAYVILSTLVLPVTCIRDRPRNGAMMTQTPAR